MKTYYPHPDDGEWHVRADGTDVWITDASGTSVCLPGRLLRQMRLWLEDNTPIPERKGRPMGTVTTAETVRREDAAAELMRQGVPRYVAARRCKVPQAQVPRIVAAYRIGDLRKRTR